MRIFPRFLLVLFLVLAATACGRDQISPDEATARADRAITMATQMSDYLKATQEVESIQAEATI